MFEYDPKEILRTAQEIAERVMASYTLGYYDDDHLALAAGVKELSKQLKESGPPARIRTEMPEGDGF